MTCPKTQRSLRRYHDERMVRRSYQFYVMMGMSDEDAVRLAPKRADNPQMCSRRCCAHHRKYEGQTTRN